MIKILLRLHLLVVACMFCGINNIYAQKSIAINDTIKQQIFRFDSVEYLEDASNKLTLAQVRSNGYQKKFLANKEATPVTRDLNVTYWYRIKIGHNPLSKNNWIIEFFDQTIDHIIVYSPDQQNNYTATSLGSNLPFAARLYHHKNFSFNINNSLNGNYTYYVRIRSHESVNVIIVLRSVNWFISYALDEYFFFGIFYGMILVFGLYNLVMFIALGQRQYLYYIVYNLSIGMYEMCADGIAYQYIWPNSPVWNHYAFGIALFSASIFSVLFAQSLLNVKSRAPKLNQAITWVAILRCLFFLLCLTVNRYWFDYKIVEIIPLTLVYVTGCYILIKGYRAARYFVIGSSFLLTGFIIKTLIALNIWWLPVTAFNYYSLSFCFIMEMLFISFAIGDRVRLLKKQKDQAQKRIISQLKLNDELKDNLNRDLEEQVKKRTKELIEKTSVIEQQNKELLSVNLLLQQQSEEISRMNILLENDNIALHNDIEKVIHDRVMSAAVDFEEFSRIYPDRESCFKFLAELKWTESYACRKCAHNHYSLGHVPYSRRCSKCGYEESVTAYTILQNTKIPITKAFYIIFLMYSTKGKISSHRLSEILSIRQSTCWAYSSRIKKAMDNMKKDPGNVGDKGWSKLVIDKNGNE